MSLTEIKGDLFAVPNLDALAHGVNCVGVMGAGIAVRFRDTWPEMFEDYQERCAEGSLRVGGFMAWQIPDHARDRLPGRPHRKHRPCWIYNLATQPRPGACASISAIKNALGNTLAHARGKGVQRIGLPQIGCGYGGLRYEDVRPLIEAAARDVDIVVVEWTGEKGATRG